MSENYFLDLYNANVNDKTKEKNGLTYLSWAAAWAEVKKVYPDASYKYHEEVLSFDGEGRPWKTRYWFDDGKTAWVKVSVTINNITYTEILPIMDFKNKPIPAESVTSTDANKSLKRCLAKCCALHGIGLYVFLGEDLPEDAKESNTLQTEVMELIQKKSKLSEATKNKVAQICKETLVEENGDPRICNNNEKLKDLKKKLMAVRKVPDRTTNKEGK